MAERRVKVTFSAEVQNFVAAMKSASKATDETKKASEDAGKAQEQAGKKSEDAAKAAAAAQAKHKDAVEKVGQAAAIGGAAVVAGVGLAVKAYADFDKQMSVVDSATHETTQNMQLLRDAAIKAGADTAFSATEAAQGIEEMAKAGVSTSDILNGGLNGTLALAAAGALGVGDASEIAASAMTQFGLKGKDIPHIADLLAAAAGKAQGSVQDMGLALSYAGVPAAGLGVSIEQTTGTIALLAKSGIVGEKAGTALRAMLVSMVKPAKETKTVMDDLGISFSNNQGEFIGLDGAAQVLKDKLGGLDEMTRNATLAQIFGNEALGAAQTLYKGGAAGVAEMTAAVNDYGYAADTARRMNDNLTGDLEKLGGSFDTVLLQSGSGANEVLRGLVQGLEGLVDTVGKVPAPVLAVGTGLAAVVGGAGLLAGGLITVIPKIRETKEALEVLAPTGGKVNAVLSKTGKIAAGAATGLAAVAAASALAEPALDQILKPTGETGEALEAFAGQAAQGAVGADTLNKSFQDLVQGKEGVGAFQTAIEGIANPGLWGNIDNIVVGGIKILSLGMADVTSTSDEARARFKSLGTELASLEADKAAEAFRDMAKATDGSDESLKRLLDYMPDYRKSLEEQAKSAGYATDDQTLLNIALGKLPTDTKSKAADVSKALEDIGVKADGTAGDLDKFTEALFKATHTNLSARDAARGFQEAIDAIDESVKKNGTTLDINTEKGRANQAALDGIANAGLAVVEANAKNGESQEALQGNLSSTYQSLIDGAGQFGITGQAAIDLAREVLKVPDGVDINSWMSDQAKKMAEDTKAAVDNIPKNVRVDVNTYKTTFEKLVGLPSQISDGSYGQGLGVFAAPPKAAGGRLSGFADGGQLPTSGPGTETTDGFLGISSNGVPMARVDAGEWIINGRSSANYNRELAAINAGTFPKLPGYANGGREYSAQAAAVRVGSAGGIHVDLSGAQFTALDPVQLRRDVVDEVTYTLNAKGGIRLA